VVARTWAWKPHFEIEDLAQRLASARQPRINGSDRQREGLPLPRRNSPFETDQQHDLTAGFGQ